MESVKNISVRGNLIQLLRNRLLPAFEQNGFEVIALHADEQKSREVQNAYPLGRLRRKKNDGSYELVEIQLEKRGAPKFRINFGTVEGIDHPVKHVDQDEAAVHYLSFYAELYSFPFFRKWFSASSTTKTSAQLEELVGRVIGLIPEIEMWFETGKVGTHVRQVRIGSRGQNT